MSRSLLGLRTSLAGAAALCLVSHAALAQTREAEVHCTYTRSELCLRSACQARGLHHHPSLLLPSLPETQPLGRPLPFTIQRCNDSGCRDLALSVEADGAYLDFFAGSYLLTLTTSSEPLSGMRAGDFVEVIGKSFLSLEVNYGHCALVPRSD